MFTPMQFLSLVINTSAAEAEFTTLAEQHIDTAISEAANQGNEIIIVPGWGRELLPAQLTPARYARTLRRLAQRYADTGWLIAIGPPAASTVAVLAMYRYDARFREVAMEHACVVV